MTRSHTPSRRLFLVTLAAGAVGAATLGQGAAQATPTPSSSGPTTAAVVAALGATRTAGTYLDSRGATVVAVTDAAAAARVRSTGATARIVARSGSTLARATSTLVKKATIAGTTWSVDPTSNQVVVTADSTVKGTKLATVTSVVRGLGAAARLERTAGVLSPRIAGGQAIYGGDYRCSLGFNVTGGDNRYFLTAGHCGNDADTWYEDRNKNSLLGTVVDSKFPGDDYALVQYTSSVDSPSAVFTYNGTQTITRAGTPSVGQRVYRSGSTTGVHSGRVQGLNATVNYADGSVYGLIRTTVCAEPGDSGGSLYSGTTAYGLTSGGSGNCSSGGTTFFQPVTEPLSVYGVSLP